MNGVLADQNPGQALAHVSLARTTAAAAENRIESGTAWAWAAAGTALQTSGASNAEADDLRVTSANGWELFA